MNTRAGAPFRAGPCNNGPMIVVRSGGLPVQRELSRGALLRLAACLAAAVLTVALVPSVASAAVTNASLNNQKMLQFMNAERAERGLSPLSRDPRLDSLAQSWANKMAAERNMYHPSPPQAMASGGYRSGAQNLAWHDSTLSASWAHNFWMNSAPHRKNILDPAFTHTGIAIACNPSGGRFPYVFATVEFGGSSAPLSSAPPVSPHVAGKESVAGAGCDGSAGAAPPPPPPAPAPPPPPAPAPVAPPPAAAKTSSGPAAASAPAPSSAASRESTSTSAAKPSPSPKPSPTSRPSPTGGPAAGTTTSKGPPVGAEATGSSGPPPPATEQKEEPREDRAQAEQPELGPLAASTDRTGTDSGALLALAVGISGILLMRRMGSIRRRPAAKHSISRR